MAKRMGWGWIGLGVLAACGGAGADYAPLRVGNAWTYKGTFHLKPMITSWGPTVTEKEALSLRVVSRRVVGDSTLFTVEMTDSLYERVWDWRGRAQDSVTHPRDTVLRDSRTFLSLGDKVVILPESPDSNSVTYPYGSTTTVKYPFFENVAFLIAHANLPGSPAPVPGADRKVMETKGFSTGGRPGRWDAWYLDDVGMYWGSLREDWGASCGPTIQRIFRLDRFNGRAINAGVEPPQTPLLKEAKEERIACSLARLPGKGRVAFARGGREVVADIAGRIVRPR